MVLELSRIRIVYDILHLRDAMYLPEDPYELSKEIHERMNMYMIPFI